MEENCKTCNFNVPKPDNQTYGNCHRYPPTVSRPTDFGKPKVPIGPTVYETDWCGEWQPKSK